MDSSMSEKSGEIQRMSVVIAEDGEDDIALVERALESIACEHTIKVVRDGQEAIDYLRGSGKYEDREAFPFPDVMLLDLKMPRVSGLEVLHWLNSHPECSVLPTIVFSASARDADIKRAYDLGASAYFVKPIGFDELKEILFCTFTFWGKCTKPQLPPKCAEPATSG